MFTKRNFLINCVDLRLKEKEISMLKLFKFFLSILIIICFLFLISYFLFHEKYLTRPNNEIKLKKLLANENHKFLINNNVAQYSSYIIQDSAIQDVNKIEAIVHFTHRHVKDFGSKENFTCILKVLSDDENADQIMELDAFESPKFYWRDNKKLIYNLNLKSFQGRTDLLDKIVVAIIWKHDFSNNVNVSFNSSSRVVLPYSLIKFQKPTIIKQIEPRMPAVSLCVPYTYAVSSQIFTWIDYHLSFGVKEITFYDATDNGTLTKLLKTKYDERINILPFKINLNDVCDLSPDDSLRKLCVDFFNDQFREKYSWRQRFEQLTSNDCFIYSKQKYEFIGYYDLDEFIFPRTSTLISNSSFYTCNTVSSICSVKPFSNNFYDYLNSLVEQHRNGRDRDKLGSIFLFLHYF